MFMCKDTPSAPSLSASLTEPVSIFLFGAVESDVLAENEPR